MGQTIPHEVQYQQYTGYRKQIKTDIKSESKGEDEISLNTNLQCTHRLLDMAAVFFESKPRMQNKDD